MLKKDDQVTIEIEDIGTDGAGIGKADGYTLFVKDAVIGDIIKAKVIKAKKTYGYASVADVRFSRCRTQHSLNINRSLSVTIWQESVE